MAVWPAALGDPLLNSYKEERGDNVVRQPTDSGVAQLRPRYTKPVDRRKFRRTLSDAEMDILDDFYDNTLAWGTLPFDWTDPRTSEVKNARFKSPPKSEPQSDTHHLAMFEFELIP